MKLDNCQIVDSFVAFWSLSNCFRTNDSHIYSASKMCQVNAIAFRFHQHKITFSSTKAIHYCFIFQMHFQQRKKNLFLSLSLSTLTHTHAFSVEILSIASTSNALPVFVNKLLKRLISCANQIHPSFQLPTEQIPF